MASSDRILFVDDDELARRAFRRSVKTIGLSVDLADGHQRAEELATQSEYGVVAVDYLMPEVDGLALVSRLRQRLPDATYILVSGACDLDIALRAVNDHDVRFVLTKPWTQEALRQTLHRALRDHLRRDRIVLELFSSVRQQLDQHRDLLERVRRLLERVHDTRNPVPHEEALGLRDEGIRGLHALFARIEELIEANEHRSRVMTRACELDGKPAPPETQVEPESMRETEFEAKPTSEDPPDYSGPEQRVHPRIPLAVQAQISDDQGIYAGVTENISLGGTFVATSIIRPRHTQVSVSFVMPEASQVLRLAAEVAWVRQGRAERSRFGGDGPGMGLRFLRLSADEQSVIERFIDEWTDEGLAQLDKLVQPD